jgi:hypothetical protein
MGDRIRETRPTSVREATRLHALARASTSAQPSVRTAPFRRVLAEFQRPHVGRHRLSPVVGSPQEVGPCSMVVVISFQHDGQFGAVNHGGGLSSPDTW